MKKLTKRSRRINGSVNKPYHNGCLLIRQFASGGERAQLILKDLGKFRDLIAKIDRVKYFSVNMHTYKNYEKSQITSILIGMEMLGICKSVKKKINDGKSGPNTFYSLNYENLDRICMTIKKFAC